MNPADLPAVLTVEEAARLLRVSRGSAYEAVRSGAIPALRVGRTIRIPRRGLLELLGESANDFPNGPEGVSDEMNERRATGGGVLQPRKWGRPGP